MTRREQCEYVYRGFQHDGRQIVEHADLNHGLDLEERLENLV